MSKGAYLSHKHIAIIKNAYGVDSPHPGEQNRVFARKTDKELLYLVQQGYFRGPITTGWSEDPNGIFYLTMKGLTLVKLVTEGINA